MALYEGGFHDLLNDIDKELVMLDIKMPKYSGLEVLEKIRGLAPLKSLPVVIVTGSDDPGERPSRLRLIHFGFFAASAAFFSSDRAELRMPAMPLLPSLQAYSNSGPSVRTMGISPVQG